MRLHVQDVAFNLAGDTVFHRFYLFENLKYYQNKDRVWPFTEKLSIPFCPACLHTVLYIQYNKEDQDLFMMGKFDMEKSLHPLHWITLVRLSQFM